MEALATPAQPTTEKKYLTVDRKVKGFPLSRDRDGVMVKPGELVDIVELSPLTLNDRRTYNLLIAHAWDEITKPVVHKVRKAILRGSHESNDRLGESIRRLMGAIAEVRVTIDGKPARLRVQLLGTNAEQDDDENGYLYYSFPEELRDIVRRSEIFARLRTRVMYCFTSKYALCLYEIVQKRVNLEQRQCEQFTVADLRALLNVPKGKLERFADFNKYALQPALKELNGLSEYAVEVGMVKRGRQVTHLTLSWIQKDLEGRIAAMREADRCSVGRRARIEGKVEKTTLGLPSAAQ
jgi:hypothetical protein